MTVQLGRARTRTPAGRRRLTVAVVAVAAATVMATGCSSGLPKSVSSAPALEVATGLWPLAQAAEGIGGDKVTVLDVVPPGADPLTFRPDAGAAAAIRSAGLVLVVGGGFQPGVEQAAKGAARVLRLGDQLSTPDPYVWLDPATMERVVTAMTDAMAAANPPAAALYKRNAAGLQSEIQSLGIDFSSTLATCPGTTIVTPDGAFSGLAAAYGLEDRVVGPAPDAATVAAIGALIRSGRAVGLFSETWADNRGVSRVAAAAGVAIHPLATLAGVPTSGTARENTYLNRMEEILATISGPLGCSSSQQ